MTAKKQSLFAGAALALAMGGAAHAQTVQGALSSAGGDNDNFRRDRNVSVRQRQHPGYQPLGLRQGAFMIWPKVTFSSEYNDNIFATDNDKVADGIFQLSPEIRVTSNWSRHALSAHAESTINQYAQHSDQNTTDYSFGADGELDVLRSLSLSSGVDFSHVTEPRTNAGSEGQPFAVQYELTSGYLAGVKTFNRLKLSARGDWSQYNYLNVTGNFPQNDRDRDQWLATARADYALSPDTAVFLEVAGNWRRYRLSASPIENGVPIYPGFVNRDSEGVTALVGANFDLAALVRGEVGVGYMEQSFKDPAMSDYGGLGARAEVSWFPTQLTTLTVTGSRSVEDATMARASTYLSTNLRLRVDHELLRNLVISGAATYGDDDYRGIDRRDKRYGAGIAANYLMNRNVGLNLAYNFYKKEADGADPSVAFGNATVNRVGLTLTLQY